MGSYNCKSFERLKPTLERRKPVPPKFPGIGLNLQSRSQIPTRVGDPSSIREQTTGKKKYTSQNKAQNLPTSDSSGVVEFSIARISESYSRMKFE